MSLVLLSGNEHIDFHWRNSELGSMRGRQPRRIGTVTASRTLPFLAVDSTSESNNLYVAGLDQYADAGHNGLRPDACSSRPTLLVALLARGGRAMGEAVVRLALA